MAPIHVQHRIRFWHFRSLFLTEVHHEVQYKGERTEGEGEVFPFRQRS